MGDKEGSRATRLSLNRKECSGQGMEGRESRMDVKAHGHRAITGLGRVGNRRWREGRVGKW